jgi:hypothetical protein
MPRRAMWRLCSASWVHLGVLAANRAMYAVANEAIALVKAGLSVDTCAMVRSQPGQCLWVDASP